MQKHSGLKGARGRSAITTTWSRWIPTISAENFDGPVYDSSTPFNDTVYSKGAWVLHMLRHVLGDEVFMQALEDFGQHPDVNYGVATTADYQRITEELTGVDLEWFFQQWVYGSNRPDYEYWWQSVPDGNGYLLTVHIDQVQTNAGVFRMPIDTKPPPVQGRSSSRPSTAWRVRNLSSASMKIRHRFISTGTTGF